MDYQDDAYADFYLTRLIEALEWDTAAGGIAHGFALTAAVARHLALWMSYEDTIRVADLKTRRLRFERFRGEVRAAPDQIVYVTEYMHPRFQEFCETLPAAHRTAARPKRNRRARHGAALPARPPRQQREALGIHRALCARGAAPVAPRHAALSDRTGAHRRVACADTRARLRRTTISRWKSPNVSAWSRATATPTSAAGEISLTSCGTSMPAARRGISRRACAGCARRRSPTRTVESSTRHSRNLTAAA